MESLVFNKIDPNGYHLHEVWIDLPQPLTDTYITRGVCVCVFVVLTQVWHHLRDQSVLLDHYIQSTPQPTPLWPQGQVPDSQGQPSSPEPTDVTQISQSQSCSPWLHFLFHPNYSNSAYSQLTCLPSVWCPSLVVFEWSRAGVLCSPQGAGSYPRVALSLSGGCLELPPASPCIATTTQVKQLNILDFSVMFHLRMVNGMSTCVGTSMAKAQVSLTQNKYRR